MTEHTTTPRTITMDNTTKRFYQGVAAAARVREAHASTLHATRQAKSDLFWFYVGALASGEYGCESSEDFTGFILGANTRAPANDYFECNHLGECDPHIVDCKQHHSHN